MGMGARGWATLATWMTRFRSPGRERRLRIRFSRMREASPQSSSARIPDHALGSSDECVRIAGCTGRPTMVVQG
eukprot:scaffold207809_cov32-Tisochrysis_lutea.AAC.9